MRMLSVSSSRLLGRIRPHLRAFDPTLGIPHFQYYTKAVSVALARGSAQNLALAFPDKGSTKNARILSVCVSVKFKFLLAVLAIHHSLPLYVSYSSYQYELHPMIRLRVMPLTILPSLRFATRIPARIGFYMKMAYAEGGERREIGIQTRQK